MAPSASAERILRTTHATLLHPASTRVRGRRLRATARGGPSLAIDRAEHARRLIPPQPGLRGHLPARWGRGADRAVCVPRAVRPPRAREGSTRAVLVFTPRAAASDKRVLSQRALGRAGRRGRPPCRRDAARAKRGPRRHAVAGERALPRRAARERGRAAAVPRGEADRRGDAPEADAGALR